MRFVYKKVDPSDVLIEYDRNDNYCSMEVDGTTLFMIDNDGTMSMWDNKKLTWIERRWKK